MESCKLRRQKWWFLIIYYISLAMIITTHSAVLGFPYDTVEMILTYKNREKNARKPWHNRETANASREMPTWKRQLGNGKLEHGLFTFLNRIFSLSNIIVLLHFVTLHN